MPAPADVQTTNGGAHTGQPESGDSITYTFASAVNPDLILSGWDGTATAVTVRIAGSGNNDLLTVRNASTGFVLLELGAVDLNEDYADSADFTNSQMTASGSTVTIVLGTRSGSVNRISIPRTMVWGTFHGLVTESGLPDTDF